MVFIMALVNRSFIAAKFCSENFQVEIDSDLRDSPPLVAQTTGY